MMRRPYITSRTTRHERSVPVAGGKIDCIFEHVEFYADGEKSHEVWASFGYDCRGLGEWAVGEFFKVGDSFETLTEAELACSLKVVEMTREVRHAG